MLKPNPRIANDNTNLEMPLKIRLSPTNVPITAPIRTSSSARSAEVLLSGESKMSIPLKLIPSKIAAFRTDYASGSPLCTFSSDSVDAYATDAARGISAKKNYRRRDFIRLHPGYAHD